MTRRPPFDLQGELRSFSPTLLFQMMALGGLGGRLTLRAEPGSCEVYFQRGKLVFARAPGQGEAIGQELVRRGLVQRDAVEHAARERLRRRNGPRLGALLVERGLVRREILEEMIRSRIKDAIYLCCDWHEGKFTFEAGAEPAEEDILLDMPLESLLLECMTRTDEARHAAGARPDHA